MIRLIAGEYFYTPLLLFSIAVISGSIDRLILDLSIFRLQNYEWNRSCTMKPRFIHTIDTVSDNLVCRF